MNDVAIARYWTEFRTSRKEIAGSIEFDVFLDAEGYLAGVDVACNSSSKAVPSNPQLVEPPHNVYEPLAQRREKT